jgi:protein-L-isoaspartate(D-aspartate) O-methyltransferase
MDADAERARMVDEHIRRRGIEDPRVLAAFRKVPRHRFVPHDLQADAYADRPLPIGAGQTISQPYMVALMTSHLRLQGHERVLEIGTGSGYQTSILAELALEVFSIERLPELLSSAKARLDAMGCLNVHLMVGDGSLGWPEEAPFDAVIVAAAAPDVPDPLAEQLAEGGRMVLPIGGLHAQTLVEMEKRQGSLQRVAIAECVFVPLVGEHGWRV